MKALFNKYTVMIVLLGILILSGLPSSDVPEVAIKHLDKVIHMIMYAVLAGLIYGCVVQGHKTHLTKLMLTPFLLASCYGLLMEILQHYFFESRSFEIYDIISNIIGSLIGVTFVNNFFNSKK